MKLFSYIPLLALASFAFLACPCCVGSKAGVAQANAADKRIETKSEDVERYYFVKGMFCGGCKIGVTAALKDTALNIKQIVEVDYNSPDPDNKIGHVVVKFSKENYHGQETDCKVVKKIKDDMGYATYWEKTNTNPCKM
jgi:copper chaperone CopZ